MAYAQLARASEGSEQQGNEGEPAAEPQESAPERASAADEAERAKARSKIWTPPGA
jgi:hypothetical protein